VDTEDDTWQPTDYFNNDAFHDSFKRLGSRPRLWTAAASRLGARGWTSPLSPSLAIAEVHGHRVAPKASTQSTQAGSRDES
jgi:hypothetical protein